MVRHVITHRYQRNKSTAVCVRQLRVVVEANNGFQLLGECIFRNEPGTDFTMIRFNKCLFSRQHSGFFIKFQVVEFAEAI